MRLYEIDAALEALVDPETGELSDFEAFEQLQMERTDKIENMALFLKNLTAEVKAIRAEEVALSERRRVLERRAESLKAYLNQILGGEGFKSARCVVSYRQTTKVELVDSTAVAKWCEDNGHGDLVAYSEPTVSKSDLARLLKNGIAIPGAALVSGLSMGVK